MLTSHQTSSIPKQPLSAWEKIQLFCSGSIHSAAIDHDWAKVEKIIMHHKELDVDLNEIPEDYTNTVLHQAIYNNQYKLVAMLLENDVSTSIVEKNHSHTPLQTAMDIAAITAIKILILNGADYQNTDTLLPSSKASLQKIIEVFKNIQKNKSQAEEYVKNKEINKAFEAYVKAGDHVVSLTAEEKEGSYEYQHILQHSLPYYNEAMNLYLNHQNLQINYRNDFIKMKTILEKIGISVKDSTQQMDLAHTEPSTPESDENSDSIPLLHRQRKSSSDSKQSSYPRLWSGQKSHDEQQSLSNTSPTVNLQFNKKTQ